MVELSFNIDYELIGKVLSSQASETEFELLKSWLEASQEARDIYSELEKIWAGEYYREDSEREAQSEAREKIWKDAFLK